MDHVEFDPFVRARLLQIVDALEQAGGTPIGVRDLHSFAYFVNVLSPLWEVEPMEGSVLKEKGGPHFPSLQREIDASVGLGLLIVDTFEYSNEQPAWTGMQAAFRLNAERARPLIELFYSLPDEIAVERFLLELSFAFLDIRSDRRDDAALVDAAWSNPAIPNERVVDFAEWVSSTRENPAWNAAQRFQAFAPIGVTLSHAEKLVMYMRLMKRRANG